MSKIYADNLARSNFDSSRGIARRRVAMQATGRDLSNVNCHYCKKFGHYKNDCADFRQSISRISDADKGSTSSEADISRISRSRGGSSSREEGGKCGAHAKSHHPQRRRLPRQAGKQAQRQRPLRPSPSSECSSDLKLARSSCASDSDEKPCISFSAREVQLATKPAKARVEGPTIRPGPDSSDGGVENSPLAIYSAC